MAKYDRDSVRVAVFFKSNDGTVFEFNQIFPMHIFKDGMAVFYRLYCKPPICSRECTANRVPSPFAVLVMNDYSQPHPGKISVHGNGLGAPSPEEVEKRAREIAMIDERNPDEFTEADWKQARRELMGEENNTPPEETPDNADLTEEWTVVAGSKGHRMPRPGTDEEETVGEHLVIDGLEEAAHDQMLEARREELEQEGDIL
jgi:hypothetical protein